MPTDARYDAEADRKEKKKEEAEPREVARKAEKGAKEFVERVRKASEVFKVVTPSTIKGVVALSIAIPSIYLVAVSIGAVAPYVVRYMQLFAPILVQFIAMFIALSIFALVIGMVRRLAF